MRKPWRGTLMDNIFDKKYYFCANKRLRYNVRLQSANEQESVVACRFIFKDVLLTKIMKRLTLFTIKIILFVLLFSACNRENKQQNIILNAVRDVDGNHYDAVRIGDQVWMKTNLRTKHFRDRSPISVGEASSDKPFVYEPTTTEVPGYDNKNYGLYYNWSAVNDERGLCPKGWHVPSNGEWTELEDYLGSRVEYCYNGRPYAMAYSIASTNGWNIDSTFVYWEGSPGYSPTENDATGFSAIPAGLWDHVYEGAGKYAFFWSSTPYNSHMAWYCRLSDWSEGIRRYMDKKDYGFSVRCLRDK